MTVNSMTGYARAQGHDGALTWTWEIKSVNGKGLELRTRLPTGYDPLDLPIRDVAQKRLKRGNVSVSLTVQRQTGDGPLAVNEAALEQMIELARRWRERAPELAPPSLDRLLTLPGVLETGDRDEDPAHMEARHALMLESFRAAIESLARMRADEGRRLRDVLTAHLAEISGLVDQAAGTAALAPAAIRERLRQQVQALLESVPALSEERLNQEAALIAAKADIREELDRLRAHLAAAGEMLADTLPMGRRLDFLCQEFNREANTLCSKANDVELTRLGLALKAVIEQFREQVQNIE